MFRTLLHWISICLLFVVMTDANAQVNFPNPSPMQTVVQDFGMSQIELQYSRPGAKNRKMIGHLEPYDSVWRTGANAPTLIRFFDAVEVGGSQIDSGTYVIYTIPRKNSWTVILNKGLKNWGSDGYNRSLDACRFETSKLKSKEFTETMTFEFSNVKSESCDLVLRWEDWMISFPIKTNIKDKLRNQIESDLKTSNPNYWQAAQFYFEYEQNPETALDMINKAIAKWEKVNGKPYWQHHYKARILKTLGRKSEALEAAALSTNQALEHGNRNNFVQMNRQLIDSLK